MEESGFFPTNNGDRKYKTELIASFFSKLYSNGVFNNELQVVANSDMTVTLKEGIAFINGYFYKNSSDKVINISLADTEQSRIDSIVLRYSKENRNIIADVIEGAYADYPVQPELTRNNNIYELRLCNILVNKSADEITTSMITDCRFNSDDCGQVISAVQQLDTTNIFAQYKAIFDELFSQMKGIIDDDTGGSILNELNTLKEEVAYIGTVTDEGSETVIEDKNGNILDPIIPHLETDITLQDNAIVIKFTSGIMIEILTDDYTNIPCGNAWGGNFSSAIRTFPDYPVPFLNVPFVIASTKSEGGNHWLYRAEGPESNSNAGNYALLRGTSLAVSGKWTLIAIGKWK